MKKIVIFQILIIVLLLSSCDGNSIKRLRAKFAFSDFDLEKVGGDVTTMKVIDGSEIVTIPQIKSRTEGVDFREMCDSVFVVCLETADSCLIGKASKIVLYNDTIFVKDKNRSLFMFDSNGRFIRKFGGIGQGPGEYVDLTDFFVDKYIYIWDNMQNRLSIFNKDGMFLYYKNAPFLSFQFGKLDSLTFVFRSFNNYNLQLPQLDDYCIWTTDTSFNIQKRGMFCDFDSQIFPFDDFGISFMNDCVSEYEKYADSLFIVTRDSELKCRFVLKIDGKHDNDLLKKMSKKEIVNLYNTDMDYIHVVRCVFNNNFVLVQLYQHGIGSNVFLYSSYSKRVYCINIVDFNKEASLSPILDVCTLSNDYFVQCEDAFVIKKLKREITKYVGGDFYDIKEDDNPVLFFYKFKK